MQFSIDQGDAWRVLWPAGNLHVVDELMRRQRLLAIYAAVMLLAALLAFALWQVDDRSVRGVNVWVKPLKFMVSTALFALTTAWLIGLLPESERTSRLTTLNVWILIATSLFEVVYITVQGARGLGSHYNTGDPFHAFMFGLMGLAALFLTATQGVLAWQIFTTRARPLDAATLSVVIGLTFTFVLGTVSGFMLGGRQPPAGVGLPLLGWHMAGGDARPAHFLGIHAHQIIPLVGLAIHRVSPSSLFAVTLLSAGYFTGWLVMLTRAFR